MGSQDWRGDVRQDGLLVARVYGLEEDVRREVAHYALMYGQDGPVDIKVVAPKSKENPQ